jgi:hypothetical protein
VPQPRPSYETKSEACESCNIVDTGITFSSSDIAVACWFHDEPVPAEEVAIRVYEAVAASIGVCRFAWRQNVRMSDVTKTSF